MKPRLPRVRNGRYGSDFSNAMAGKIKLTNAEWELARKSANEFAPLLGIKL